LSIEITKAGKIQGEITPPPDKSISHRAVIFSSIASGKSVVKNFLNAQDTQSTVSVFRALGVDISQQHSTLEIIGTGLGGLREPSDVLDCGNSGTTMRLLSGLLAGMPFLSVLTGDDSLRSRPMRRVTTPLSMMGASIQARQDNTYAPLCIRGGQLSPIRYEMPMASAQVKSSILLAALSCDAETEVVEPVRSRDHTERMLPAYGVDLSVEGTTVKLKGPGELKAQEMIVPNDFSSAAFFIVAALIVPGSELIIRNVGLNPTRTGLLPVLKRMGANIEILDERMVSGEPVGDLKVVASSLKGTKVVALEIPSLVDEFPILCIAAAMAEGKTEINGAGELRVKESDRIAATSMGLKTMGVIVDELQDGVTITGSNGTLLNGGVINSHHDHRIAMSFAVAGLVAQSKTVIEGEEAVDISFPGFFNLLKETVH
jgi:3-phosphoshikimate 1-carboxyvinyltransferase